MSKWRMSLFAFLITPAVLWVKLVGFLCGGTVVTGVSCDDE